MGAAMGVALRLLWPWGAVLLVLAGLHWHVGRLETRAFDAGVQHERTRLAEERNEQLRESMRLGSQMAATARAEAQTARDQAAALMQETRRRDRAAFLRPAQCGLGGADPERGADGAAAGATDGAAPGQASGPGLAALPRGLQPDAGGLTAAAVSVWDSALAGTLVPAGACRADDLAAGACAAATGLTVDDAIDNHIVNAARCREDRIRHRTLIEYLHKQGTMP